MPIAVLARLVYREHIPPDFPFFFFGQINATYLPLSCLKLFDRFFFDRQTLGLVCYVRMYSYCVYRARAKEEGGRGKRKKEINKGSESRYLAKQFFY